MHLTGTQLNPVKQKTLQQHVAEFDFVGLFFIVSGVVLLLLGFNAGETDWSATNTIVFLVLGVVLLIAGAVNEALTGKAPIIPPRLFKTRTTFGVLFSICASRFCQMFCIVWLTSPEFYTHSCSSAFRTMDPSISKSWARRRRRVVLL